VGLEVQHLVPQVLEIFLDLSLRQREHHRLVVYQLS
jgi:hypothetical protein